MKTRHLVYRLYAFILGVALLVVGGSAHLGHLLSPAPHAAVLTTGSATVLGLAGMVMLAAACGWHRIGVAFAGLLLAVALFSLTDNLWVDATRQPMTGVDFVRTRSTLAVVMMLLVIAVLSSRGGLVAKASCRVAGATVAVVALLSHFADEGSLLESVRLGFDTEAAAFIDLFILLLGGATWLFPDLQEHGASQLDRDSWLVGLVSVMLAGVGGYLLAQNAFESVIHRGDRQLARVTDATHHALAERLALIQRMAERWEASGRLPSPVLWKQEARSYLRDISSLQMIAVLDDGLQPRWLEERGVDTRERLRYFQAINAQKDWLRHIQDDLQPHVSGTILQGILSNGVLIAVPLHLPQRQPELIVASLSVTDALEEELGEELDGFVVRVHEDGQLLYDSRGNYEQTSIRPINDLTIELHHDMVWHLVSYPEANVMRASAYLPTLVMFFGLCFSFFLLLSQRLSWLAGERSRHLSQVNQKLTESLQQQTSLEALNQRIMHFSLDVLCSIDEQGRFIQLSPSSEAVFGYRPEEMVGRKFIDFVLPEDRERTLKVVEEGMYIGGRDSPHFRNRYRHKDGHTVHIMWSATWSKQERNIFAIAHDITRLVQSEAFTEGQRDILEMVSTNQPLPYILDAICVMAEAKLPGARCSIQLMDADQECLLEEAAPSRYHQAIHGIRVGPEGCTCASNPISGSNGAALGTLALYHHEARVPDDEQLRLIDICSQLAAIAIEREHDRNSLQESEQRYRSLFAFNPNPVFSIDPVGTILSINQAGCDLSGYAEQELVGQHFSGHIQKEDLPSVMDHFGATLSGEPRRYEVKVVNRHGEIQELDVANLPIIVGGQIVGMFGIGNDITERKAAERALHSTLRELEHSNRELQDFAFVASHDLQEPLRKIQAFSERLEAKATALDSDSRDYLQRMSSAAGRMQALIRDLLAYSRIGTHGQPFVTVDLNQVLSEVLQDLEVSLEASGAHIEHETLPSLQGDETQIRQLLQNLIGNALKFHQEGEPPHVRIHTERTSASEWTLCVTDHGIGFDEKYLDRIFNPFQRLHGRQAYAGTGIGLAIVKKITERHGARVTANSQLGRGTTFRITFQASNKDQDHAE